MPGRELTHRLHLPSLAVELPDGWSVFDEATFASPSGTQIRVRLGQAEQGLDSSILADHAEAAARAEVVGIDDVTASTIQLFGGLIGHQRRYAFERDGVASIGRIVCFADGGLALTVGASWAAGNGEVDAEVDAAVAGIRLMHRPLATLATATDPQPSQSRVKRTAIEQSAWSDVRVAWNHAESASVDVVDATRLSSVELAVCATILEAPSFPTVGSEVLASLPAAVQKATVETVMSSFIARGLLGAGDDGWARLCGGLSDIIDVAVFPDLTISIERLHAGGSDRWWFGVRPDSAVQITVLPNGSRECGQIDAGRAIDQMLAITGTSRASSSVPPEDAAPVSVTLADLAAGAGRIAAVVRVNTAWRVGEMICGGALSWATGVDGSQWLAKPDANEARPSWTLAAVHVEGLRAELLAHLPGATESSPS